MSFFGALIEETESGVVYVSIFSWALVNFIVIGTQYLSHVIQNYNRKRISKALADSDTEHDQSSELDRRGGEHHEQSEPESGGISDSTESDE